MFSKKGSKAPRERPSGGKDLAKALGIGVHVESDDVDDEASLLAELAALEGHPVAKRKTGPAKGKSTMAEVESMVAESMKDIDFDEDLSDEDFDENDLLGELNDLVGDENEDEADDEKLIEDTNAMETQQVQSQQPTALQVQLPQAQTPQVLLPHSQPSQVQPPQSVATVQPSLPSKALDVQGVLKERKITYTQAIEEAKADGNSSKIRRYQRALKEVERLLKAAQRGGTVSQDEIPPPVALKGKTSADATPAASSAPDASHKEFIEVPISNLPATSPLNDQPAPEVLIPGLSVPPMPKSAVPPTSSLQLIDTSPIDSQNTPKETAAGYSSTSSNATASDEKSLVNLLQNRQMEFKMAALKMKQEGNIDLAKKCLSFSKVIDSMIEDVKAGKDVDISNLPKLPDLSQNTSPPKPAELPQPHRDVEQPVASASSTPNPPNAVSAAADASLYPKTVMEALEQRLVKFRSQEAAAKQEGNGGKARRMGRIVKQYQEAIRNHKANIPVEFDALPCPPGCGPIPGAAPPPKVDLAAVVASVESDTFGDAENTSAPSQIGSDISPVSAASASAATLASNITPSRNQKECEFLINRQKQFKILALEAKKAGDIENARNYLRQAKGLDGMIKASENGLRVDVTKVPALPSKTAQPQGGANTEMISKKEVEFGGSTAQQYAQIESALRKQLEMSEKNLEHYKLVGNLNASKNFQSLYESSKKDLDTLLLYKNQRSPTPRCHSVLKTFPVIRSNPHLSDSELEVIIVRCINVPLPPGWAAKDMYTYVTYEVAYPQEKPQIGNTSTKKETINPEFDESSKVLIDRKNRAFARFCKRHGINVKVNYVRGFLKSDKALGQATIKFERFNNRCEIHECVDLMDLEKGRKAVGGKIEVKLRIREPLADKDTEIIKENWLILDSHLRHLDMKTPEQVQPPPSMSTSYESIEVLKFEKELCEKKIIALKNQGKNPPQSLMDNIKAYQLKMHSIQMKLKEGGRAEVKQYFIDLATNMEKQKSIAQEALKRSDKEKAKLCLAKKKLMEKEVTILKQKMGF